MGIGGEAVGRGLFFAGFLQGKAFLLHHTRRTYIEHEYMLSSAALEERVGDSTVVGRHVHVVR